VASEHGKNKSNAVGNAAVEGNSPVDLDKDP